MSIQNNNKLGIEINYENCRVQELECEKIKIDAYDRKIIHFLSMDSRVPVSEIAKKVRLSRDSVEYRVNRLVENNIILAFAPIINLNYFGYDTFHVFMILNDLDMTRKRLMLKRLVEHPNTKSLMEYTDKWDMEWVVVARSLREFDEIISEITTEFKDVIVQKNKLEIIKGYKSVHLPKTFYVEKEPKLREIKDLKEHVQHEVKYDEHDIRILRILSNNCRESSYNISNEIGLSPNAVRNRIKKMLEQRIIWHFSIIVNLAMLDLHWYSLNLELKTLDSRDEIRFKEFVTQNPYIIRAVKVLGSWDIIVYIVSETLKDFHLTVKKLQQEFVDSIYNYETLIAYKERVYRAFPLVLDSIHLR